MLVLGGLVGLHRNIHLQLLQHYWMGHRPGLVWYWVVCLGSEQKSFCCFWDSTQVLYCGLLLTLRATPILLRDSCSQKLNSPIPAHFSSLIPKMSVIHSCHLLFDHSQFALIYGPNIPGSYAILFFTASDFTSITGHIHNWVLFLLWLYLFSGVISPPISCSI